MGRFVNPNNSAFQVALNSPFTFLLKSNYAAISLPIFLEKFV